MALFIAVVMIGPAIARPLAEGIGAPIRRLGGVPGDLGVHNAGRNPARTARTATALMIGLTLVTLVAALGSGLRGAIRGSLEDQVIADYVVQPAGDNGEGVPVAAERAIDESGLAERSSACAATRRIVLGDEIEVTGVNPIEIDEHLSLLRQPRARIRSAR